MGRDSPEDKLLLLCRTYSGGCKDGEGLANSEKYRAASGRKDEARKEQHTMKIFIIEDEVSIREELSQLLSKYGLLLCFRKHSLLDI